MQRSRPVSGFAVVLAAGTLVLAGCGGGGSSKASASAGSSTTTTAATGRNTAAFAKYRDCLKQHGVDLPNFGQRGQRQGGETPGSSVPPRTQPSLPAGVTQQQFDAAQQACESLRPAGGFGGGGGGVRNSAAFKAYVSCLADHGVAVSTTTSTSTTAGTASPQRPGQQFDRNDPHFASANQVCMALLPQPSTTTTTAQ
jgi:hypothetical protein